MTNELALPDTSALDAKALALVQKAEAFTIRKAEDYAEAAREDNLLIALIREVDDTFEPIVQSAKSNYDKAREGRDRHRDPLIGCRKLYKGKMGAWKEEEDRIRREKEKKLQEEADRAERTRQLAAAEEAKKQAEKDAKERAAAAAKLKADGDKKAAAEALKAAEAKRVADLAKAEEMKRYAESAKAAPVEIESKVPDVAGISSSKKWYAEVTDLAKLVASVLAHPEYIDVLEPAMPKLNQLARTMGRKLESVLAGVSVREKTIVTNRG